MPPKGGSTTTWDNPEFLMEMGIAFFVAAQATGALSQNMRDAIIDHLQSQGHQTTWEAIRQHVQKLRRNRDTSGIQAAVGGGSSAVSTPRKTPRKRQTPIKKGKGSMASEDDLEDIKLSLKRDPDAEDSLFGTPKPKRTKKEVKPEPEYDEDFGTEA